MMIAGIVILSYTTLVVGSLEYQLYYSKANFVSERNEEHLASPGTYIKSQSCF